MHASPTTSPGRSRGRRAFVAAIAVLLLAGLVRRLARLDAGLWIDEAGTLWCVEGDLAQCVTRSLAVEGQSPLAYALAWASVRAFGESEWALRLPSFLAGCAAALLLVPVGRAAGRPQAGWIAAALLASSTAASAHGVEARPTALAAAFTALLLLGFLRAAAGAPGGRPLFVASGLLLFYAHYVLVLPAAGLALAWALRPELRARWPARAFALDVGLQVALAAPGLVDLARSVRPGWTWQDDALPGVAVLVLGPAALVVVAAWQLVGASGGQGAPRRLEEGWARGAALALGLAAAVPVGVALLLAPLGVNLLILRYLSNVSVPAAALVGLALWVTAEAGHARHARRLALVFLLATGPLAVGAPPISGGEGWREAVARVAADQAAPAAPVLYRSGFVEDDERPAGGSVSGFTLAPLRAPGQEQPPWPIVPLTCTWEVPGRAAYLEARVGPVLAGAARVYVVSHASRGYLPLLAAWIDERFPGRFERRLLDDGRRGVFVLRLDARLPAGARAR